MATDDDLGRLVTLELAGVVERPRLLSRAGLWVTFVAHEPRDWGKVLVHVRPSVSVDDDVAEQVLAAAADGGARHPAVLPVHRFGRTRRLFWISLPEMGGRPLRQWFSEERVPSAASALEFLRQVAAPLTEIHAAGLVHGALTTSSFHRDASGVVRICCPKVDLALLRGDLEAGVDSEAVALAAPEVEAGLDPDAAADQYALAAILVKLSTGLIVTPGEDLPPEVPSRWAPSLRRALDRDPRGRWPGVRELVEALDPDSLASAGALRRGQAGARGTYQPSAFRRRRRSGRRLDVGAKVGAKDTPPPEDLHLLFPPLATEAEEERAPPEQRAVGGRATGRRLAGAVTLLLILGVAGLVYVGEPASLASGLFAAALEDWYAWAPIGERLERSPSQPQGVGPRALDERPVLREEAVPQRALPPDDSSLGAGETDVGTPPASAETAAPPEPAGSVESPVGPSPDRVEVASSEAPPAASSPPPAPAAAARSPTPTEPLAPGRLSLQSYPWGAVYIDGVFVGNTPLLDIRVPAGDHQIRIERPPYDPFSVILTVEPGQMLRLTGIVLTGGGR